MFKNLFAPRHGVATTHHPGRSQPGGPAVRLHGTGRDAERVHGTDVQRQIAPNLWIDRASGNHYLIGVQYPEDEVRTIQSLEDIPISSKRNRPGTGNVRKLKEMAKIERTQGPLEIFRHTGEPVSQLYLNVEGNDLRVAETTIREQTGQMFLEYAAGELPESQRSLADDGTFKERLEEYLREGQKTDRGASSRNTGSIRRRSSAACASRFAARFRHDQFIPGNGRGIGAGRPARLPDHGRPVRVLAGPSHHDRSAPLGVIGVALVLWATKTSLNIQSCMGVLMMIGISVSNSVLLIEFANRERSKARTHSRPY